MRIGGPSGESSPPGGAGLTPLRRALILAALVAAGEAVFLLPFVLARAFRPTFLDVFEITNLQLGTAFSLYGIVAMAAYFAGGPIADRFSARRLMTIALLGTGAGGVVLASVPSIDVLNVLYAYWGLTTILLFWSALIRATREWGGDTRQGAAYGLVEGGRGFLAAITATVSVLIFAALLPVEAELATDAQRHAAFSNVIWVFTGLTLAIAVFVWLVVPDADGYDASDRPQLTMDGVKRAARLRVVWLQAVIVICAYVAYKATDDFSLLARDAFGYDEVAAAGIGSLSFWIRGLAAIGAGFLGDRVDSSRVIGWGFFVMIVGSLVIASGLLPPDPRWLFLGTLVATSVGIYALRGVYFALLAEGGIPLAITGSAAGLVSVFGYTPDVFMGPLMGYLLDRSPGALGHQHVFLAVAVFGVVGLVATALFRRATTPGRADPGVRREAPLVS